MPELSSFLVYFICITRNVLDCDQSNYSSRIIFPRTFTLELNTNRTGWPAAILDLVQPEVGSFDSPSLKTPPRMKHEGHRTTRSGDIAI